MLASYKRLLDRIGAIEQALGIALIFLIVAGITVQVFTRYALGRPIVWVEESATYAFIWMVFVGASAGLKQGRHILIATFGSHLPPRVASALRTLVWLLVLVTLVVLVVQGLKVMDVEGRSRTISLPIELPRSWFYSLPLTLSAASMALTSFYLILSEFAVLLGPFEAQCPAGCIGMTLLVLFGLFAILVVMDVPVAFAMGLSSIATIVFTQPIPLSIVVQRMGTGLDSFVLIAIPLFVFAGHLLNRAGIAQRIFAFSDALVGHVRGGLAHVNVVASMIFAGMSGVAQADAAGLGVVEVKAMRDDGYDPAFAGAVSAASAIIGPIIPPSVIMVVYAVLVQASVAELFLAGFLPGLLMGGSLMVTTWWLVRTGRVKVPATRPMSYPRLGRSFVRALPALAAPVLLTVGLLAGVATPTELGALVVVYAAALGFVQRELTLRELIAAARETLITCGVLVFIIACAVPFGWLVATSQAPMKLAQFMMAMSGNKFVILAIINVALLLIGCFMETTAVLLIATPTLYPLVTALGIDPVHFGIILIVNLLIGTLTPPFGVILFIMMDIAKISLAQISRAVLPFYLPLLFTLLVITYWADFVLAVPRLFGKAG